MRFRTTLTLLLVTALIFTWQLSAQERGAWHPASKTAQSITGDVTFNGDRMTINFFTVTVAEIRPLKSDEISAAFDITETADAAATAAPGTGHLFRLSIPGDRHLLHKNTLCGSDETQWMATYVSGKELHLAFFSNAAPPMFTLEALRDSPNLCGTFLYARY